METVAQGANAITVYWWNGRTRKLDYKGTIEGFLVAKGITWTRSAENGGRFKFRIPLAFETATLETGTDFPRAALDAIKIFVTLLGDKTLIEARGYLHHINWR